MSLEPFLTTPNGIVIKKMAGTDFKNFNVSDYNSTDRMRKCNPVTYERQELFASVDMPEDASLERKEAIRGCMFERLKIYTYSEIPSLPDGSFTYLVSERGFFANQVFSRLEIGSIHAILAKRSGASKVFCAGEMRVSTRPDGTKHIEYNELSGTYMGDIKDYAIAEKLMHYVFSKIHSDFGISIEYKSQTEMLKFPLTEDELKFIKSCGYDVSLYKHQNICTLHTEFKQFINKHSKYMRELASITGDTEDDEKKRVKFKSLILRDIYSLFGRFKVLGIIDDEEYKRLLRVRDHEAILGELAKFNLNAIQQRYVELNSDPENLVLKGGQRRRTRHKLHRRRRRLVSTRKQRKQ